MSEKFVAETSFNVRYAETDAMGIVHHASYIVWFEEGRSHYMRQKGTSYADFERSGFLMIVTDINAKYKKAAVYDERVTVRCWLAEARSRTLTFAYEIVSEKTGELYMSGTSKHVCTTKEGQIARIPKEWMSWIN